MEIEKIKYNIQTEFHMLRHFSSLDHELRGRLLASGKKNEEIDHELKEPGSRFHSSFANTISELLQKLDKLKFTEEIGVNGNIILKSISDTLHFPNGIGTLNVVPIEKIKNQNLIYKKINREIELLHYDVDKLPEAYVFSVIISSTSSNYQFITAFPGEPAMPIPKNNMSKELNEKCKRFWSNHVFLVKV